jgi:hypothetical protein
MCKALYQASGALEEPLFYVYIVSSERSTGPGDAAGAQHLLDDWLSWEENLHIIASDSRLNEERV